MAISKPIVTPILNGVEFDYIEEQYHPTIQLRNFSHNRSGHLIAELDGYCLDSNIMTPVKAEIIDLNSLKQRRELARGLKESYQGIEGTWIDWREILADISWQAIDFYHNQGQQVQEIWPSEDVSLTPEYLINPILYLNQPTIIFGEYSSGKSLFAQTIAYLVQLPVHDNNLSLATRETPSRTLYLDYEGDETTFKARWSSIQRGFGLGEASIFYMPMSAPLADCIKEIQQIITEKNINFIIIDSLGLAAGGNLNEPEPATRYYKALRLLNRTSLTLAHTSKDPMTTKRTIFGSVFFTNLARLIWECKAEQEVGDNELTISLSNPKANLSKRHAPLGFHFTFADNAINIEKTDLATTSFAGGLPLAFLIKDLLRESPLTNKDIAEALNKPQPTIKTTLIRMSQKGSIVKLPDHKWGLTSQRVLIEG